MGKEPMNVIVPLGGVGRRFAEEGYINPKPLVKVLGKSIINWVLESLKLQENDALFIIYHNSLQKANFEDIISRDFPGVTFRRLANNTRGAAETVLKCIDSIPSERRGLKTVCLDGDTFYEIDVIDIARSIPGGVVCFEDRQEKPIYSYVSLNDSGGILDIAEKSRISDFANTGCYVFESAEALEKYCKITISNGIKEKGEFYISAVLKAMLEDGLSLSHRVIGEGDFVVLGTPYQVKLFSSERASRAEKKRFCFDIDNTILSYPEIIGDYSTCKPIEHNIEILRHLKSSGHTVILYTARRMKTHGGNIGAVVRDIGALTIETLEKYAIPYDEIYFGKPFADFYIDDLAINTLTNIEKQIGFYRSEISERDFNSLGRSLIETIVKSSKNKTALRGEIHWYENMPIGVADLFPRYLGKDKAGEKFEIEKIKGVSLSHLYLDQLVTPELLTDFLESISRIHDSVDSSTIPEIEMYANYSEKLKERFENYDYSRFDGSGEIFRDLNDQLEEYEKSDLGDLSAIHGDPVFTNVIVKENQDFCFIDMRGEVGGQFTIFGDLWYDYGKILQSLTGYDEILLGKFVDQGYKNEMIEVFRSYIEEKFGNDRWDLVKIICSSLIFSLIPLHDNEKVYQYYSLIK